MGKVLRVSYAKINNMGDLLNELIIKEIFGYDVVQGTVLNSQLTAIGSGLDEFIAKKGVKNNIKKVICKYSKNLNIWSTGFIRYSDNNNLIRKKINVCAVRGELTRKRLEKVVNKKLDIPTGDGGLLASLLIKNKIDKKYSVGIIPHYKERNEEEFYKLMENYKNALLINLAEDPIKVIKDIASCEYIISSSLHGLIVADSFNIPNIRVKIDNNKILGDGYKFNDYYSAFGIKGRCKNISKREYIDLNEISDNYKITNKNVDEKKEKLIKAFPFT